MNDPGNPIGGGRLEAWLLRLLRYCRASAIVSGPGYRVKRMPFGTALAIEPGAGGSSSKPIVMHRLKSVEADHLVCRVYNAVQDEEGSEDVLIAKPFELRESKATVGLYDLADPDTAVWQASISHEDSDFDGNRRQLCDDSGIGVDPEVRYVTPIWEIDVTLIWAIRVDHTGVVVSGNELTLLDLNVAGRCWTKEYAPPS